MNDSIQVKSYISGLLQGKAYRVLTSHLTKALFLYDISIPEWKLLGLLSEYGEMRLTKLAEMLSVEAPLVTALVDKLEKKDLVRRTNDSLDKRAKVIVATKKGLTLMDEIEPKVRESMRNLLQGVTYTELVSYLKVLEAIVRNG